MNAPRHTSSTCGRVSLLLAIAVVAHGPSAEAGSLLLGDSGWQAIWDDSLDPFVDIAVDLVTADAVFIEKSAEFIDPPGPGGFPAVAIVFRQVSASAVNQIVFNDEIITNSTGADWGGFRFEAIDHGEATFNPALSAGFRTGPFGNRSYSADRTILTLDGIGLGPDGSDAVISDGDIWFPGIGAGELYIDVIPQSNAPFALFTLKETPIPEPISGLLLATGALCALRRRHYPTLQ